MWESRDIYKLGEWGIIDGKKLYIWKIETVTKGNELYHTYYMKTRAGLQTPVTYNASLAGVSLLGRVTDVKEEKIQIELYDDENRENAGKRWFPYATVYSSPDGTGWYCMPEYIESVLAEIQQAETEQDFLDIRAELREGGFLKKQGKKEIRRAFISPPARKPRPMRPARTTKRGRI